MKGQEAGLGCRGPQRCRTEQQEATQCSKQGDSMMDGIWELTLACMQSWAERQEWQWRGLLGSWWEHAGEMVRSAGCWSGRGARREAETWAARGLSGKDAVYLKGTWDSLVWQWCFIVHHNEGSSSSQIRVCARSRRHTYAWMYVNMYVCVCVEASSVLRLIS